MGERLYTKTDTLENWQKAKNFIPKKGELIFYSDIQQTKIGDGITKVNDLEYVGQKIITDYDKDSRTLTLSWK